MCENGKIDTSFQLQTQLLQSFFDYCHEIQSEMSSRGEIPTPIENCQIGKEMKYDDVLFIR